jgi:hypothetical protein
MESKIYSKKEEYIIKHWFDDIKYVANALGKSEKWVKKRALKIATHFNSTQKTGSVVFDFNDLLLIINNWNSKLVFIPGTISVLNEKIISQYKKKLLRRNASSLENYICDMLNAPRKIDREKLTEKNKSRNNKRWSDKEIHALKKMCKGGASYNDIMRKLKRSLNSVSGKMRKLGITNKKRSEPYIWDDEKFEKLIKYYNKGYKYSKIAKKMNTSISVIDRGLQKLRRSGSIDLTRRGKSKNKVKLYNLVWIDNYVYVLGDTVDYVSKGDWFILDGKVENNFELILKSNSNAHKIIITNNPDIELPQINEPTAKLLKELNCNTINVATIKETYLYVDPPFGWQYGFPKKYNKKTDGDINAFFISNGYPAEHLNSGWFYYSATKMVETKIVTHGIYAECYIKLKKESN